MLEEHVEGGLIFKIVLLSLLVGYRVLLVLLQMILLSLNGGILFQEHPQQSLVLFVYLDGLLLFEVIRR